MIVTKKTLDDTDKKIIQGIVKGLTAKEIGRELRLSPHTISGRIKEMKRYYKCSSIAQLAVTLKKRV